MYDLEMNDFSDSKWIYIDWLDGDSPSITDPSLLLDQAEILERAVKEKLITLVFDRSLSLKDKEIAWLLRFNNTVLLEPALNNRRNFEYLPFGVKIPKDFPIFESKPIDLYIPNDANEPTVDFCTDFLAQNPEFSNSDDLEKCKYALIVNTDEEDFIGFLPDLQPYFQNNVIPLIHEKNKYYHSLFKELVFSNFTDVKNMILIHETIGWALLKGLYDRIESRFPEMKIENVIKKIKAIVEEKTK